MTTRAGGTPPSSELAIGKTERPRAGTGAKQRSISLQRSENLRLYGWVLGITACMLLIVFISRDIYPFGDRTLRYQDGYQYLAYLRALQRSFFSNDNLLYSWSTCLGNNLTAMLAYYCSSPFNLLAVFFPNDLMLGYHVIFALKFMAAALCFAVMLRHMFPEADAKAIVLFSVSYPFTGYMTYYAWNQSWMDAVILLPLIVLGLQQLVTCRQWLLYTVSLAGALFANFYTGYMVVIAAVLFFAAAVVLTKGPRDTGTFRLLGMFAASTVGAAALAAVLLLPTYAALPGGRAQSLADHAADIHLLSSPAEILSMLYTAPYVNMKHSDNSPVIFTGLVQLVLVVLFFLNRNIRARYKVAAGALLGVFVLSFSISLLNVVWHAFSVNRWFNYRYSFLVCFLLEFLAFCSFSRLSGARGRFIAAGAVLAGITAAAIATPKHNLAAGTVIWDIICIGLALVSLHGYAAQMKERSRAAKKQRLKSSSASRAWFGAIAVLTLSSLMVNTYLSLDTLGDMGEYEKALETDREMAQVIDDDSFFRAAQTWRYGLNNPLRAGYAGVENFSSAENSESVEVLKRLGLRGGIRNIVYGDNVPLATDALLGLRYIATSGSRKAEYYTPKGQIASRNMTIYENDNALPVVFPGETRLETADEDLNRFEYMNSLWNSVSAEGGDIFREVSCSREDTPQGNTTDIEFSFTADTGGPVYAYVPLGDVEVDTPIKGDRANRDIIYLGDFVAGEKGSFTVRAGQSYDGADDIVLYSESPEVLDVKASEATELGLTVDLVSSSELSVKYSTDEDGFLTSTIPYDVGWSVTIDGTQVDTYRNMDYFLAFDCPPGSHDIRFTYWPPYLTAGILISVSAAAVITILMLRHRRRMAE